MEKVDLEYYLSQYVTGYLPNSDNDSIPELMFERYEKKARQMLSSFTFNRLETLKFTDTIKDCICEMAEMIYYNDLQAQNNPKGIASESTDGHSVTYRDSKKPMDLRKDLYSIAVNRLAFTGLLYTGVPIIC